MKKLTTAREWLGQAEEPGQGGATYEATGEKLLFSIAASLIDIREELRLTRRDNQYRSVTSRR